ncbi:MAG: 50S ribosomal protein L17 [Thermodesulfovibrio sp. RBG_19FT_COMBO_41_18]|jgi:large subunit ribosomal protein L17|nr:MAG: 50S ribosomal protein L17 [Thermodesulfovibrio sp. RBG_19FT_COMBO_41_18]
MRHRVDGRLFGRTANQRKALLKGIVASLLEHERIETTVAKAKEVRKIAERIITLGIKGDLHSKRLALSYLSNRAAMSKLFGEIAPRLSGRNGGYLRIIQTRNRVNDSSPMAVLEFVDYEDIRKSKEVKKSKEKKTEKKETEKTT